MNYNEILEENTFNAIKALSNGMVLKEVTKEYSLDNDGEMKLIKKKINEKMVPPNSDIVKLVYSSQKDNLNKYQEMSDDDLEKEKLRLLKELKKSDK